MSEQYYLDPTCSKITGSDAVLGGDDAHHFVRVMRGKVGDPISFFDGKGFSYRGVVEAITRPGIRINIIETDSTSTESPIRLTVATALPKGDRQKFLVEKLTELGVARLIPLRCERGVAKADTGVLERLRRQVVEASKQSMRTVLMEVAEEISLRELRDFTGRKFLLHPVSDGNFGQTIFPNDIGEELLVAVGPEGGFTSDETNIALENGFTPIDLGPRILRTETACLAVAAKLLLSGPQIPARERFVHGSLREP